MKKKMFWSAALVAALVAALLLIYSGPATATNQRTHPVSLATKAQDGTPQVGTEAPCIANNCLFYAGDFDANGPDPNGLWNGVDNFFGFTIDGTVWVPVTIPKHFKGAKGKTDWNVSGLFVNNLGLPDSFGPPSAASANWSIVQGVAQGGSPSSVTVFCSGTSPITSITPTGRTLFGFFEERTYLVLGITGCPILEAGTYWMTVVAQAPAPPAGFEYNYLSDVEDATPMNAEGPGSEPSDLSFFTSSFFGFGTFDNTSGPTGVCGGFGCNKFSVGVIGTTVHR